MLEDLEKDGNDCCTVNTLSDTLSNIENQIYLEEEPDLTLGIKLPTSLQEWEIANKFFKFKFLNQPMRRENIDQTIETMNSVIYDYFLQSYGTSNTTANGKLMNSYKDKSVKELKADLNTLKSTNADTVEIKFVANLLCTKLQKTDSTYLGNGNCNQTVNHVHYIKSSFWGYVKAFLKSQATLNSTLNKATCICFFSKYFSCLNLEKFFSIPNWIPSFAPPKVPFSLDPPTYQQVTNIICKMKSSSSPCPLDQLSSICFEHCPYLRSYVTNLIREIWKSQAVPTIWKKACTILIHKKGDTSDPSNFRPITLQSFPLKIFTSCLKSAIFKFLSQNNYIEQDIQKGFIPKVSGTLEHTFQMATIIDKAHIKQCSLVITLLDLKNAFGEVHHNLIYEVVRYHHIPDHIISLIKSLYTGFQTSIITSNFQTPYIPIRKGVLLGDCLSILLFNLCFNTFIQHIKVPEYRQFGFLIDCYKSLSPVHWFQFADDAAVISGQENENQHLLNRFTIWCKWAQMIIRVDKCTTFGNKKSTTKSTQYKPKLLINSELVPCVEIGDSFRHLGRYFDFDMSNTLHKRELSHTVTNIMSKIDLLPLHPRIKLQLYNHYRLPKISWHLTVADLTKSWVSENLDNLVAKYFRSWLDLPISGTLSNIFLSHYKFGLNLHPPSVKYAQCQTILRNLLKSSPNEAMHALWKETSASTNIQYDQYKTTKDVLKSFHSRQEERLRDQLFHTGPFFGA